MKSIIIILTLFCTNAYAGFASVNPSARLDILFVIDDSGSMYAYQEQLANNLGSLLTPYKTHNLHIGIITTSINPKYSTFPKLRGSQMSGSFDEIIEQLKLEMLAGDLGSGIEMPLHATIGSLSSSVNKGFLRKSAKLKIVFVTDEPDQSKVDEFDFMRELTKLKDMADISLTGILYDEESTGVKCKTPPMSTDKQTKLTNLIKIFKGDIYSICAEDWSSFSL